MLDKNIFVVLNVGVVIYFTFTAFDTLMNVEKTLLSSAQKDDSNFKADGFTSLAIVFMAYAIFMWFVPSVIDFIGLKGSLITGTVLYIIYLTSFLTYSTWYVYVSSAVAGIASSLTWTAGGSLVTKASDETTIVRNFGILFIMYNACLLGGNTFEFIKFQGLTHIDHETRTTLVLVLLGFAVSGVISACIIRPPQTTDDKEKSVGPVRAILNTLDLVKRRDMQLMCVTFFYNGLFLAFTTGVYSPSIGATLRFESSKSLIGLSGVFMGIGGLFGSIVLFVFGKGYSRWERRNRIICCAVVHAVPFALTILNLPNTSPQGDTCEEAIISSSAFLAMATSSFYGLGATFVNNMTYDNIGYMFEENHTGAVAIFNFFLSAGSSLSFFYSSYIGLYTQFGILVPLLILSVLSSIVAVDHCKNKPRR